MTKRTRGHSWTALLTPVLVALMCAAPAEAQQIGHRVLGSLGLLAGSQPESGIYVVDEFASYGANKVYDNQGHLIPIALDLDAWSNPVGFQMTFKVAPSLYLNVSAAGPISQISLQTNQPDVDLQDFGFGDIYVQPLKIGWKTKQADLVGGYGFYAPTGLYVPRNGGVGLGQWTHEFSLGGAFYFDRAKTWNISALASYDLNQHKEGIDIKAGDTVQFQGGAGKIFRPRSRILPIVNLGVAAYGLRQVHPDRGSALPAALYGAREVDLGLGPEIDLTVAPIRGLLAVRYCRDIDVKARQSGHILVIALTIVARR